MCLNRGVIWSKSVRKAGKWTRAACSVKGLKAWVQVTTVVLPWFEQKNLTGLLCQQRMGYMGGHKMSLTSTSRLTRKVYYKA